MGVDDYLALLVTQDEGSSWQELARWDNTTNISPLGQAATEIALVGYDSLVQFAFYAFSDASNKDNDLFIDNFQITTASVVVSSSNQSINDQVSIYPNPTSGMVSIDLSLIEKPTINHLVNAGIYVINKSLIIGLKKNKKLMMNDFINKHLKTNKTLLNYPIYEKWIDIGNKIDFLNAK